jgi:hypothetical protein
LAMEYPLNTPFKYVPATRSLGVNLSAA